MISLYRYDKGKQAGRWSATESVQLKMDQLRERNEVLWLDLDNPTPAEEQLIFEKLFKVHPLTLQDITRLRREPDSPPHLPKVEEFSDYLFVVANPLTPNYLDLLLGKPVKPENTPRPATQLSAVITENLLVTHHYE